MFRKTDWRQWVSAATLALLLTLLVKTDLSHLDWVEKLSLEGSPAPQIDPDSPTGYELGQRHFLGIHNRGETYRWIAYTQELIANGFFGPNHYELDTAPTGRPQLLPKLFAAWLAAIAGIIHLLGGDPFGICVEKAALWEPIAAHAIAFIGLSIFMLRRFGAVAAILAGLFFTLFPLISAQYIPGAPSPLPWALLLATYSLALLIPNKRNSYTTFPAIRSAIALGIALWLDPSVAFPALLITTTCASTLIAKNQTHQRFLTWAITGSILCLAAWAIDQSPLSPDASELRYLHPLYALCWLGIGLLLDSLQRLRNDQNRNWKILQSSVGLIFIAILAYQQFSRGYLGWLFSGAAEMRIASLDETKIYENAFAWTANASGSEIAIIIIPLLAGCIALVIAWKNRGTIQLASVAIPFIAALILTAFKIRWGVVVSLLAIPMLASLLSNLSKQHLRNVILPALGIVFFSLFALGKSLPDTLKRPEAANESSEADLVAMMYRHFSHWLATHNPDRSLAVLAPPETSDSILFHGGKRCLMSTAWESFPGQTAASRILSSPEDTEAEAVIQSREITTLVFPSWDPVLPMLLQQPDGKESNTFFHRIEQWLLPLYIKPVPYHLPPNAAFSDQKFAVFEVSPLQDEALSLSRLAEYFVEQRRSEPAQLVAKSLADSFPDDPNATLARSFVYADAKDQTAFLRQISKLADDTQAGLVPMDWDRRVLRAIALALGKQHKLAKDEIVGCLETITESDLYQLSSQQTFQFLKLIAIYKIDFQDDRLKALAIRRCSEYI